MIGVKPMGQSGNNRKPDPTYLRGKGCHGETNVESSYGSLSGLSETWLITLTPKGMKFGCDGSTYIITSRRKISGLKTAPKTSELSDKSELGNPYCLLIRGRDFVRRTDGQGGRGGTRKRKPVCNGPDRSLYSNLKGCKLGNGSSRH